MTAALLVACAALAFVTVTWSVRTIAETRRLRAKALLAAPEKPYRYVITAYDSAGVAMPPRPCVVGEAPQERARRTAEEAAHRKLVARWERARTRQTRLRVAKAIQQGNRARKAGRR